MASWIRGLWFGPKATVLCDENTKDDKKAATVRGHGEVAARAVEHWGLYDEHGALVARHPDLSRGRAVFDIASLPPTSGLPNAGHQGRTLRVVVISDTHEFHRGLQLPPGDVLLHCGDVLTLDKYSPGCVSNYNLRDFFSWFNSQPFALRVVIGGNHDHQMERLGRDAVRAMAAPSVYIEDELVDVCGLRIFGSPRSTPNSKKSGNLAFQLPEAPREERWPRELPDEAFVLTPSNVDNHTGTFAGEWTWRCTRREELPHPDRLDFYMTHGAPTCRYVRTSVMQLRPALHFCGHVHEAHGVWLCSASEAYRIGDGTPATHGKVVSVNGGSTQGGPFKERLAPPVVIDYAAGAACSELPRLQIQESRKSVATAPSTRKR